MASIEKQKQRLQEQIERLQGEMNLALQKKSVGKAFDVPGTTRKIREMKAQLEKLQ